MVLMTGIMDIARRKGIPFEAVYRLAKPSNRSTLERMMTIAYEDWQTEQESSPSLASISLAQLKTEPYLVHQVVYQQPTYPELRQLFDWVQDGFRFREFKPTEACKGFSVATRDLAFELFHLDQQISTEDVLAEMVKSGLRPALYEELLAFVQAFPDEQRKYPIVALGSVCRKGQDYCCPSVLFGDNQRKIDFGWLAGNWHESCRFLAVKLP